MVRHNFGVSRRTLAYRKQGGHIVILPHCECSPRLQPSARCGQLTMHARLAIFLGDPARARLIAVAQTSLPSILLARPQCAACARDMLMSALLRHLVAHP